MSEIIVREDSYLAPAATVETMLRAYQAKKQFIEAVLKPEVDFGTIPGSDKPALKKAGAEKLSNLYGLSPTFEDVQTVEDWTGAEHNGEPFFYYRQRCTLTKSGRLVASADGSCNSWEKKYRYRSSERTCPSCGQPTIFKSKKDPEFYCWAKKGGCGAKFELTDTRITGQELGQVKNPDVAELVNTILKMAQKRALVAATLIATCASDYFTQDIDDFITGDWTEAPAGSHQNGSSLKSKADPLTGELPTTNPLQPTLDQLKLYAAQIGIEPADIKTALKAAGLPEAFNASRWNDMVAALDEFRAQAPAAETTQAQAAEKPWTSTLVSLETARAAVSKEDGPYWDMPTEKLTIRFNSLVKALKDPNLTPEQRDDKAFRRDVIQAIIDHRGQMF